MISKSNLLETFSEFRDLCLSLYPNDIAILSLQNQTNSFGEADIPDGPSAETCRQIADRPIESIFQLIKTPRILKTILRHTYTAWCNLHGEIDFDDLMTAYILRFSAPEAFDYILENCTELRSLELNVPDSPNANIQEPIDARWEKLCKTVAWEHAPAKRLIQYLFIGWRTDGVTSRHVPTLQGFQNALPTDYWLRFIRGKLDDKEIRDQDVVLSMQQWLQDITGCHYNGHPLYESLCDDYNFEIKFAQFATYIMDAHNLRTLATQLFAYMIKTFKAKACSASTPSFISLKDLTFKKPIDSKEHAKWVKSEIFNALPHSLSLASDIFVNWNANDNNDLKSAKDRRGLTEAVVSEACSLFKDNPAKLISVLSNKNANSCANFIKTFSKIPSTDTSILEIAKTLGIDCTFQPTNWQWFSKTLLADASLDRELVTTQIAHIVTEKPLSSFGNMPLISESSINAVFGKDNRDLMEVLSTDIPTSQLSSDDCERLQVAREYALNWLTKNAGKAI